MKKITSHWLLIAYILDICTVHSTWTKLQTFTPSVLVHSGHNNLNIPSSFLTHKHPSIFLGLIQMPYYLGSLSLLSNYPHNLHNTLFTASYITVRNTCGCVSKAQALRHCGLFTSDFPELNLLPKIGNKYSKSNL